MSLPIPEGSNSDNVPPLFFAYWHTSAIVLRSTQFLVPTKVKSEKILLCQVLSDMALVTLDRKICVGRSLDCSFPWGSDR